MKKILSFLFGILIVCSTLASVSAVDVGNKNFDVQKMSNNVKILDNKIEIVDNLGGNAKLKSTISKDYSKMNVVISDGLSSKKYKVRVFKFKDTNIRYYCMKEI